MERKKSNFHYLQIIIIYIDDSRSSTREILQLINTFCNVAGYKINFKKSVALLYTNDKEAEKEIRETSPFIIATNSIKYLEVALTKEVRTFKQEL